ncbi:MAG: DUF1223 domain-containing protein [Reichenbachiella sp.]|uniref:DUF1223 domain-containing protein n=1 Tax=Reichenbachiella sp. TaxID=2184521 RepID=UPI003263883F
MRYLTCFILLLIYVENLAQSSGQPIAIVELFTSQGCSSCPSADRVLREAVNSSTTKGEIYGLSFHVSYWNRLGWKDPYSSEQFTERQKWYAKKMHLNRIYTPQMIVDGKVEFVGSQKDKLRTALKSSFVYNKKSEIAISNLKRTKGQLQLVYSSQNITQNGVVNVAVVQKTASNHVSRGENRNKTLVHSNVVRAFYTSPIKNMDQIEFDLPQLSDQSEYEVVIYVQNPHTLKISAVTKVTL